MHPPLIGATDFSKNRKYYEDDTGNCKWLKETKCSKEKQPRKKKEKVCKWETYQVSPCKTSEMNEYALFSVKNLPWLGSLYKQDTDRYSLTFRSAKLCQENRSVRQTAAPPISHSPRKHVKLNFVGLCSTTFPERGANPCTQLRKPAR